MIKAKNIELLKEERVQQEISRHRWIESEKAGQDIGYDKAAGDWLNLYSDGWLAYSKSSQEPKREAKKVVTEAKKVVAEVKKTAKKK